jgi:hypothetical protein
MLRICFLHHSPSPHHLHHHHAPPPSTPLHHPTHHLHHYTILPTIYTATPLAHHSPTALLLPRLPPSLPLTTPHITLSCQRVLATSASYQQSLLRSQYRADYGHAQPYITCAPCSIREQQQHCICAQL